MFIYDHKTAIKMSCRNHFFSLESYLLINNKNVNKLSEEWKVKEDYTLQTYIMKPNFYTAGSLMDQTPLGTPWPLSLKCNFGCNSLRKAFPLCDKTKMAHRFLRVWSYSLQIVNCHHFPMHKQVYRIWHLCSLWC